MKYETIILDKKEGVATLTLDRRHLLTPAVLSAGFSVKVLTPGDFLNRCTAWQPAPWI